jgi:hypothetical protein
MLAAVTGNSDLCITHSPGCMFIANPVAAEILRPNADLTAFPAIISGPFV